MTTMNPFSNDPIKADIFEQGYAAGFMDPDSSDFRPFSPDLLDVFEQGFRGGRGDKSDPPQTDASCRWLTTPEVTERRDDSGGEEGWEHLVLFLLGEGLDHLFEKKVTPPGTFGLIDLVITSLGLRDTPLGPLPPDFRAEFNRAEDDPAIHYIAMCPRSDHTLTSEGVTADGYWTGQDRGSFFDGVDDMTEHGHSEAIVARCDLDKATCGVVWMAVSPNG